MRSRAAFVGILMAGLAGGLLALGADNPLPPTSPSEDTTAVSQLSKASEALYKQVSGSLIRVKLAAPKELMKEFEEWRQKQIGAAANNVGAGQRRERPDRREQAAGEGPTTMPGRAANNGQAFRRFLEQKLKEAPDSETQARIREALARLEAMRTGQTAANDAWGVVVDEQGDVLVAWGWVRENPGGTYRVVTADGTELSAKYVGANNGRGIAVLKLDSPGAAKPLEFAVEHPAAGELLMCLSARQGAVGWVTAPGAGFGAENKPDGDGRFAIFAGDGHGPTYLFNTQGQLTALGMDHFALPIGAVKAEVEWIIDNKKDIAPRRLGVKYDPLLPAVRRALPALGDRAAVLVKEVAAGSPADKAGLKKGDVVVTIDDISIALLPRIQFDLATRSGAVAVSIFRGGKEMSLDMPLDDEPKPDNHKRNKPE